MSATEPAIETGRDPARLAQAVHWLAEHAHHSLGTEMVVQRAGANPAWRILLSRRHGELSGVSASTPAGQWFLESDGPDAVDELASAVLAPDAAGWPAKVTASGQVKVWLRPRLLESDAVVSREHDLLTMVCHKPPDGGEGRWAGPSDRPALERYQAAYNEERKTSTAPDWSELLRRPAVAVLEEDGHIVAVVKRTGDTTRYATIGGTWTDPSRRQQGLAARLTTFIVGNLLLERPAVHLVVDDDNPAAIALYRSLGFEEIGGCYMAYLSPA
jgi:ribosomal protein S18 acetylase RimI-like enzyme